MKIERYEKEPEEDFYSGDTNTEKGYNINIGGMWEFPNWKILENHKIYDNDATPCRHCYDIKTQEIKGGRKK